MLKSARVIKATAAANATALEATRPAAQARVVKSAVLDARVEAERIIAAAQSEARRIVHDAELGAQRAFAQAEVTGLQRGLASAASQALHIAQGMAHADAQATPRVIELARALSERLLGRALALEPQLVGELALASLQEVRGLHAVQFECHPEQVVVIEQTFARAQIGPDAARVVANVQLAPGDFRLRTAAGVLDANVGSRLELLCRALLEGTAS
jgi:flagellar biosynthesis/type III secretory pathway protein FliH